MRVQDVMTRSVTVCWPGTDLASASNLMRDNDCGALPVVQNDLKAIGVITDRDICITVGALRETAAQIKVDDVITGRLYTCNPNDDVKGALQTMRKEKVRRLPVTDNSGFLRGIITLSDIALCAGKSTGAERPIVSYEDFMATFSAISEPEAPATGDTRRESFAAV